ncbi:MAG: FAD-binding oxidoreductase [Acidobacteriia bacterium]|nr:FAD-binding oxidoreductase [Terriglobia bacterium]
MNNSRVQTEVPTAELGAIVGADHLRPATSADAVDGIQPQWIVEPGSEEELARVLQWANSLGIHVVPRGQGTKLEWGNLPRHAELVLSTLRLNRVVEHAWGDMTATVEAGCLMGEFQKTLSEHGQRLAYDALWPERSTMGGILATNDSGSYRIRFGALRDLIIGITLALPDGTLAKSGGKVVKNVAGYDLPKLATGSLGTLGVITQAIFRLHPLPQAVRSLSFSTPDSTSMNELVLAVQDSKLAYTGLQIRADSHDPPCIDVRFEGTPGGIDAQARQLLSLTAKAQQVESFPDVWNKRQALWTGKEPNLLCKFSVLPSQLGALCAAVFRALEQSRLTPRLVAQGLGLGFLRLEGEDGSDWLAIITRLREEMNSLGGTLGVLHCPLAVKSHIDVWGPVGDSEGLMHRVKNQFDPAAILNPGRFVGGI